MNEQRLITSEEVAEYLAVDERTLSNWRIIKKGPRYMKIGRSVRYTWEDVHAWVANYVVDTNE